ncbi:hypothetical protein CFP65_0840 [Kitasatospora sp. MMS16-BH015]|nr:hypothetical protein CFP65_0840 [Kitasatospora sp. MMS16-BH015]
MGKGSLDNPTLSAQSRAVLRAASGDHWLHAEGTDEASVLVVAVATVTEHHVGPVPGPPSLASHRRNPVKQRDELGDIATVAAGQRDRERDTGGISDQMMLTACPAPVHRASSRFGAPFNARMREPSTATRGKSGAPALRSLASRTAWSRGPHTGLAPFGQATPARHPGAEAELLQQRLDHRSRAFVPVASRPCLPDQTTHSDDYVGAVGECLDDGGVPLVAASEKTAPATRITRCARNPEEENPRWTMSAADPADAQGRVCGGPAGERHAQRCTTGRPGLYLAHRAHCFLTDRPPALPVLS